MSEPCRICGGSGLIKTPMPAQSLEYDPEATVPAQCPACRAEGPEISLTSEEMLARHLYSLSCHLNESAPVHGHQGWQAAPLNFYWKQTYVEALREAAARIAPDTHARPKDGAVACQS